MAEGDTIYLLAAELRPYLVGRTVLAARTRSRAQVGRLVGTSVSSIETAGKNLLIQFSSGLSLRTHLRMTGTWHLYRAGEPWRRPASRAALVLELEGTLAVCFDAPIVELFETRAIRLHPALSRLGPDLLTPDFDDRAVLERFRRPASADVTIGEALLDQGIMAGVGNVYRSEILFLDRVDPFAAIGSLDDATIVRLVATARRLLVSNVGARRGPTRSTTGGAREAAGAPLWVYRRTGRACRRCGTAIRVARLGRELPRPVWWCPRCQPGQQPAGKPGPDRPA